MSDEPRPGDRTELFGPQDAPVVPEASLQHMPASIVGDPLAALLAEALPYVSDAVDAWDENDGEFGNKARRREARDLEARIRAALASSEFGGSGQ